MKSGTCYLIGAGEHFDNIIPRPDSDDYVIAVDGGYDYCVSHNIIPNIIMGDFDSSENDLGSEAVSAANSFTKTDRIPVKSFPPEKDFTDMALAADEAMKTGCSTILIYGGTGGRPDHTISNIQLISHIADMGISAYMYDKEYIITAITNGSLCLNPDTPSKHNGFITSKGYGYISVFSLSDVSENVSIKGLKYEVNNITLRRQHALGTSNEFLNKPCCIEVESGSLLILAQTLQ